VLHLLYARFWHKALFDLGHVSTPEPFQRLFNQGYIQAAAYSDERGHPRLFMRHKGFPIDPAARDLWLGHMREAVAFMDPPPAIAARLLAYFDMAAEAMRNRD